MTDLKKLRELADKATKGKWKIFGSDSHVMGISIEESIALGIPHAQWTHNMSPENAAFSVAANPETVIALLDRIEKLDSALSDAIVSLKQLKHSGLITEKAWDAVTDSIEKLFVLRRGEP